MSITAEELCNLSRAATLKQQQAKADGVSILMKEYLQWIRTRIPSAEELRSLASKPNSYSVILASASPPSKRDEEDDKHLVYFSGFDGAKIRELDPANQICILSLWLGIRKNTKFGPINDPSLLPGGKTIIDLLNDEFCQLGFTFAHVWSSQRRVDLHMVWDKSEWHSRFRIIK